jgi:ubiquinone/menaquinone biosynthesis C-methylase UbiE
MIAKTKFFDLTAPFYEWVHFSGQKKTLEFFIREKFLRPDYDVIDLAGGTGRVAEKIVPLVRSVTVVDASEPMLAVCRKKGVNAIAGFAEKIPFADDSVDRIIVIDAFHHFQDQIAALNEMHRVLKPGGQVFIEEVSPGSLFGKSLEFAENVLGMGSRFHLPENLAEIGAEVFENPEIRRLNGIFYAMILKKNL